MKRAAHGLGAQKRSEERERIRARARAQADGLPEARQEAHQFISCVGDGRYGIPHDQQCDRLTAKFEEWRAVLAKVEGEGERGRLKMVAGVACAEADGFYKGGLPLVAALASIGETVKYPGSERDFCRACGLSMVLGMDGSTRCRNGIGGWCPGDVARAARAVA